MTGPWAILGFWNFVGREIHVHRTHPGVSAMPDSVRWTRTVIWIGPLPRGRAPGHRSGRSVGHGAPPGRPLLAIGIRMFGDEQILRWGTVPHAFWYVMTNRSSLQDVPRWYELHVGQSICALLPLKGKRPFKDKGKPVSVIRLRDSIAIEQPVPVCPRRKRG
jgi:hypothetical protein